MSYIDILHHCGLYGTNNQIANTISVERYRKYISRGTHLGQSHYEELYKLLLDCNIADEEDIEFIKLMEDLSKRLRHGIKNIDTSNETDATHFIVYGEETEFGKHRIVDTLEPLSYLNWRDLSFEVFVNGNESFITSNPLYFEDGYFELELNRLHWDYRWYSFEDEIDLPEEAPGL